MTAQDILDGASEAPEVALPKPTFDEVSQPAGSELSAEAIAQQFEQRLKDTEERLSRKFQSQKDKELADIRRTYGDLSEVQKALAEVKAGGDPDKVFAALEQRNLYQKVAELEAKLSAPNQSLPSGNDEADKAYEEAVGLLQQAELTNDPEVMKLMGGRYKNPNDMLFAVNKFVLQRNTKRKASPASASSPAGGGGATTTIAAASETVDNLTAQYARASSPSQRAELKAQLAAARVELEKLEAQG